MSDRVQYIILAEDQQAQSFAYRALIAAGANRRKVRQVPLPSNAGGGGHGFVLGRYLDEVTGFRRQHSKARSGLVVHLDADDGTVGNRHKQLAAKLTEAAAAPRGVDEPIAHLVPRRNIETWIHALDDSLAPGLGALDEERDFPKLSFPGDCATAATGFADHCRQKTDPDRADEVPSLLDGIAEFRRVT